MTFNRLDETHIADLRGMVAPGRLSTGEPGYRTCIQKTSPGIGRGERDRIFKAATARGK